MQEDFLQYLWKYALYPSDRLRTVDGRRVEVVAPGQLNRDAGPDFTMARIRIDGTLWIGHVEIHVKASDWYRHGHQVDPSYGTVILHVVYEADCEVARPGGDRVPTVVLPIRASSLETYHRIISTLSSVPCEHSWQQLNLSEVENWIVGSGIGRIEKKSEEIEARLAENRGGWEETFLQVLFRTFGFGINQESFDRLGRSLTPAAIRWAGTNLFRMEALLFGQAGLIPERPPDPYSRALNSEYGFLRKKLNVDPLVHPGWKYLRLRPANFPTIRIAQLASLMASGNFNASSLLAGPRVDSVLEDWPVLSSYWRSHYDFGKAWAAESAGFGKSSFNLLMVNAIIPMQECYSYRHGDRMARERWLERLESLPSEDNRITRLWNSYGYRVPNAFYSQAFLHLYHEYCRSRRCLSCRIGQQLVGGGAMAGKFVTLADDKDSDHGGQRSGRADAGLKTGRLPGN